jgi:predicted  nucleic acid-binding Zn-ribbon protein
MAGPDLTYNSGDLATLGDQLGDIADKLDNDKRYKGYDKDEVAHQKVADAIDDFVNDWDDKRNKLKDKVAALGEMARKSHEEFDKADLELAASLEETKEGGK